MDTAAAAQGTEPHERPWYGPYLLVAFVALVVCTNIANVGFATVKAHPERLIMLSSRNRYLILAVGAHISPLAYVAIATVRLTLAAAVCHFIGRVYGHQALRWFTRFLGMTARPVDRFEQQYRAADWVLIPIFVGSKLPLFYSGTTKTR